MERSCDSSPQSLTTTQEQLTTLRALPSRSRTPAQRPLATNPHQSTEPLRKIDSAGEGEHTEAGPLAELLAIRDLDEGDLVLGAERNDELLVGVLLARLVQDAHVRLAAVERLGGLAEAAGEAVVHERELEDALERVKDRHLALGGGVGRDLDLIGHGGGGGVLFYVRLSRGLADVLSRWTSRARISRCPGHWARIGGRNTHHLDGIGVKELSSVLEEQWW